ncbi:ADP-heptose:LPS heptosyltransferase [Sulfurivirga caldicuralii]|uniref:ADP-heptose:LPS heptosyltransferase n=1 Tax=Sulfurivirga caldicuralii TaxID=364032 RepID=A0A1N6DRZ2_9GAMM|nr:glycosyltransferase family 9 protein [Sulfurivirga caldicuralii]SIN73546.1 ADP-heptose:LPS heptosyltransferase [Sulfurivirga caldicuralii]
MNVDLMRKVDHHLGIPLTALSTPLIKLIDRLRGKKARPTPKRILFVELSEMGSTILADPAMRHARDAFDAELHFVIFAKNKPSLDLLNTIPQENIFTLREDSLFTLIWDALRFMRWCRQKRIDTTVDLELFSRASALLTGWSLARNRVGFHNFHGEGLWRGDLLTHRVLYNPHMHISKNFMALVYALEAKTPQVPYTKAIIPDEAIRLEQVHYSEEEKAQMHALIQKHAPQYDPNAHRLVLINPNASELLPQRRWPAENYRELIRRILAEHDDALVLITGAPAERDEAEALRKAVGHERCINFAGGCKFTQLPLLYSVSTLMVTNDSGPGHFSAITPLKTFVLFGPETPALYGSLGNSTPIWAGLACSPCVSAANHRKTPCTDPVCMRAINVEQVFNLVDAELRRDATTPAA